MCRLCDVSCIRPETRSYGPDLRPAHAVPCRRAGIMPRMSDAPKASRVTSLQPLLTPRSASGTTEKADEKMVCERCGRANVYRMHAVWRCTDCGFKTDCCGW